MLSFHLLRSIAHYNLKIIQLLSATTFLPIKHKKSNSLVRACHDHDQNALCTRPTVRCHMFLSLSSGDRGASSGGQATKEVTRSSGVFSFQVRTTSAVCTCLVSCSQPLFLPPFLYADIIGPRSIMSSVNNGGEKVVGYVRLTLAIGTYLLPVMALATHTACFTYQNVSVR